MTSFAFVIEPPPQTRLAAGFLLLHTAAALLPWYTRCPPWLALLLSLAAVASFALCLARVPGRHCRLQGFAMDSEGCRAKLAADPGWRMARLGPGTRASRNWVLIDLRLGRSRAGWLLPRSAVPAGLFRRLKARARLHLLESDG